ncbi:MAG: hypothetical protein J2P35_10080 [Actinobacteria bacterium]|nr:hypothetical protein [Actinomycetota bacterium]
MRQTPTFVTSRREVRAGAGLARQAGPSRLAGVLAASTVISGVLAAGAVAAELAAAGTASLWAASAGWVLGGLTMLTGSLAAALRLTPGSGVRRAYLLYAAGASVWVAGAAVRLAAPPGSLSWAAAICWLVFTIPCIISFARRLPRMSMFGVFLLDAIPVVLLAVAIARTVAAPAAGGNAGQRALGVLYPVLYLLLAANSLEMTGFHRELRRIPAPPRLFTLGYCLLAVAALSWGPQAAASHGAQGHLTDPLWTLGLLAIGAGGVLRARRPAGSVALPVRANEVGPQAIPAAAAILGLIIMLAAVRPADELLLQSFLLASALALIVRVALMRRDDLRLLADLGRSQGRAAATATAARQTADRLRLLASATARIRSLVPAELMQSVCDTGRELTGAGYASFGLIAPDGRSFTRLASSGGPAPEPGPPRPAGRRERDGRLVMPVPVAGSQQAELSLAGKDGGFDEEDETLVSLLAANAGHALENAQLYAESRAQQEQLSRQNERLRELDHMKDEFVALVSHELRTPLTSIVGYLELLTEEDADRLSRQQRRFTTVMHRNARRLLNLVGDLLFLGGLQRGELDLSDSRVDLPGLVQRSIEAARPDAASKQIVVSISAAAVPPVPGDEGRLEQLIGNLVSNAIKFTPPGGRVTVTMQAVGDFAVMTVTDTGIGIPEADLPHIFERFYRSAGVTRRAIQGSGLGLTISKAIVDAHGGTISAESEPGRGTTFRVRLPLRRAAPARPGLATGTARVARLMRQRPAAVTGRAGTAATTARRPAGRIRSAGSLGPGPRPRPPRTTGRPRPPVAAAGSGRRTTGPAGTRCAGRPLPRTRSPSRPGYRIAGLCPRLPPGE